MNEGIIREWYKGWKDGWMDGWMDGSMDDESIYKIKHRIFGHHCLVSKHIKPTHEALNQHKL